MSTWWEILSRKKRLNPETISSDTQLARVLTTFDLTALGVGSTLGVGVYVLAGHVAKDTAGPSVVLSFLIAAVASVFAGLCYAEFGARVPRAGSAYIYSYVCVGEFIAFIIGWNLILEYVIGSASVAKGLSLYLDSLLNNTLKTTFREIAPMNSYFMAEYFDFFSFGITLVLGAALAFGLKESTLANNIFTILNIFVVLFVIIAGALNANLNNWSIRKQDIPANVTGGDGGFFPFGIEGTIKGAATCFYGFVGFDCIATTGEEVKNPQRAIPISIILSLFIIFLSYFGTSTVLTLMCPYYLQDSDAPIPHVFAIIGWDIAKWIVAIGGIFGLCASLFGAMFPLPRIIYAMASDALVFKFLGAVNSRFKTPVVGTLLAALLTGLMSAIFNLKQLVNMMSIGTLLAYTIVAACVVILRYSIKEVETAEWNYTLLQSGLDSNDEYTPNDLNDEDPDEHLHLVQPAEDFTMKSMTKNIFNFKTRNPTRITQKLVTILVFLFTVLAVIVALCVSYLQAELEKGELKAVVPIATLVLFMLVTLASIYAQPKVTAKLSFKVPLVPIIPALSIFINIYLMVMLDINTWIRFSIWMIFGVPIYLTACLLYSKQKPPTPNKSSKYGIVNHNFSFTSNGDSKNHKLTIPEIRVVRPSIVEHWTTEEVLQQRSETQKVNIEEHRKSSEDRAITKAVSELDKVILESEEELQEAINPETELTRHSVILERNRDDSYSSDSGSETSKEVHVKAIVHQEDVTIKEETITILNHDDINENIGNISNVQLAREETEKSRNEDNLEATLSVDIDKNDNNIKLEDKNTLEVTGDEVAPKEETEEASKSNEETKLTSREMSEKLDSETGEIFIPRPPPLSEFLESQIYIPPLNTFLTLPLISPRTKYQSSKPVIVTAKSLGEVQLQPVPAKRLRSDSLSSVGSLNNIKPGSRKFEKFKTQLNSMLKKKEPLKIPERRTWPEDLTPSPRAEKQVDFIDQMLDQSEEIKEIPLDFGKTKEFKENLNSLLLRKQNKKQDKLEYVREYEDKDLPVSKEDVVNHKKKMLGTLNSIKLRKTGLKGIDLEFQDAPDDNADEGKTSGSQENFNTTTQEEENKKSMDYLFNSIQMIDLKNEDKLDEETKVIADKERHKRYMVDTLKTLKLRKTGINLNEENTTDANPLVVT